MKTLNCLMLLLFAGNLLAQKATFSIEFGSDTINPSTPFEVVFLVAGGNASNFKAPEFKDFEVLYRNQSSQMNFINGEMNQSIRYIFGLKARTTGSLVIEQASVQVKGQTLYTDFVKVVADENYVSQERPRQNARSPFDGGFDDFFGRQPLPQSPLEDYFNDFFDRSVPEKSPTPQKKKDRQVYKI
jgi:hypothetical protein